MKKLPKILAGIIFLIVIFLGGLIAFLDRAVESYRPQIEASLSKNLNQPVNFDKINAKVFPELSIMLEGLNIGTSGDTSADKAMLVTDFGSLVQGEINVSKISLEGVKVLASRDKNGIISLANIPFDKNDAREETSKSKDTLKKTTADSSFDLKVKEVDLKNISITFNDAFVKPNQTLSLINVTGNLTNISSTGTADAEIKGNVFDDSSSFEISGLLGNPLKNQKLDAELAIKTLNAKRLSGILKAYGVELQDITLDNSFDLDAKAKNSSDGVQVTTELNAASLAFKVGESLKKEVGFPLTINTTSNLTIAGAIETSKCEIRIGDTGLSCPFGVYPNNTFQANISATEFKLSELSQLVAGLAPLDPNGSVRTKLSIRNNSKNKQEILTDGDLKFNGVTLELPQSEEHSFHIKDIKGDLQFTGNKIESKNLHFSILENPLSVETEINLAPKKVTIRPTKIIGFGGTTVFQATVEEDRTKFLNTDFVFNNLNLAPISDMFLTGTPIGVKGFLKQGIVKLNGNLENLSKSVKGMSELTLGSGYIEGVNIVGLALDETKLGEIPGLGGSLKELVPEEHQETLEQNATEFKSAKFEATLDRGHIILTTLKLSHPLYSIIGDGSSTFAGDGEFDASLRLSSFLSKAMVLKKPALGILLNSSSEIQIPITLVCRGWDCKPSPDVRQVIRRATKNVIRAPVREAIEKIDPKVGKDVGKLLDSLF